MKIHRIELQGFGPYRDREVVDFDAFEADGIFLITGRTGAGKTSVLDAVTFALFGRLPRYDGTAGANVRSDHITPTDVCEVMLEFSVPAGRYRATRRPAYERPKLRGEGNTLVKPHFELSVHGPGGWEVLEAKVGNAERHVDEIFPLTAAQFQQVILLPQGEFQEFLVADSRARRELLSQLFDTSRFTAYSQDLESKASQLRQQVNDGVTEWVTQLKGLAQQVGTEVPETVDVETGRGAEEWLEALLAEQLEAFELAREQQRRVDEELLTSREALAQGRTLVDRQQRLARARARHAELLSQADAVAVTREEVALARRAAVAAQTVRAVELAQEEERERRTGVVRAETAYEEALKRSAPAGEKAARSADSLATLLGSLEDARRDETTLPALAMARTMTREAVEHHQAQLEAFLIEKESLQTEVGELDIDLVAQARVLEEAEDAPLLLDRAKAGLVAANEHATLAERLGDALGEQASATAEQRRLSLLRSELTARQYAEYAGVLAHELVDGDDCPVCGSTEHPARAERAAEHVSVEQVERVTTDIGWAEKKVVQAGNEVARLETKLAELLKQSQGRAVEEWRRDVDAAEVVAARRAGAQGRQTSLNKRRPTLVARMQKLDLQVEVNRTDGAILASQSTLAEQKWRSAVDRIETARGEYATVAERVGGIQQERTLLEQVVTARAQFASSEQALATAHRAMVLALAEQGFDRADAVHAAQLEDLVLAERARAVDEHAAALAGVTEALASPDLVDVPDDPVDLEALTAAATEAAQVHSESTLALGQVQTRYLAAKEVIAQIRQNLDGSQTLRREWSVIHQLAQALRGQGQNERKMMLESFALAAELEEIVAAANGRLTKMTEGRYEFLHSDALATHGAQSGLALEVLDAHTGEARSPKSLSGGEKFQASLALALGLAEVVTARAGGLRLDTLFIDEGFGTLDPETLESTMATLDSLREGGRTVGLISHVATLKESIPAQLHVEVTPGGWSTLSQA